MNEADSIATWEVLHDFGFQPDAEVISTPMPGRSFDFGNFKLSASNTFGRWMNEVVRFGGVLSTPRSLAEVGFEMPRQIESHEQCAAWIVWHLDKCSGPEGFIPDNPTPWLALGRANKDLLPWERERILRELKTERYRARPHCSASRKWLRLALNTMAEHLEKMEDEDLVRVGFKDGVLTFHVGAERVVVAAEGDSWRSENVIPVGKLRKLPKRLMNDPVSVGIWEAQLEIDRCRYDGVSTSNA